MKVKLCYTCNQEKPLEDFYKHPNSVDGRGTRCKPCARECDRIKNRENPRPYKPRDKMHKILSAAARKERRKEYLRAYNKEYYKKNRERLIENAKRIYRNRKKLEGQISV